MASVRARKFSLTNDVVNRLVIPVLNSRAGQRLGRRLAVVEYLGRRSGQRHQLVTQYVTDGQIVRIKVGMAGSKTWWRNFQEPHRVRLRLAGVDYDTSAHVVRAGDQVSVEAELERSMATPSGSLVTRRQRRIGWGLLALAAGLAANSLLGPLALGVIEYRYGASMINQAIGLDSVALFLVAPVSALAGALTLSGHRAGPVLGLAPAAFAAYMVPQYVIGPEYARLPGNNERFFPFHLALFILSTGLLLAAWATTDGRALPPISRDSDRRRAWVLVGVAAFILVRWLPALAGLLTGAPPDAAYRDNPTSYLLIALLDLGLVVPAALVSARALRRGVGWGRKGAYAVIGWFATVLTSVAAMSVTMQVRGDPNASPATAAAFGVAAMVFIGGAALLYRPLFRVPGVPARGTNEPDLQRRRAWRTSGAPEPMPD